MTPYVAQLMRYYKPTKKIDVLAEQAVCALSGHVPYGLWRWIGGEWGVVRHPDVLLWIQSKTEPSTQTGESHLIRGEN